MLLSTSRQAAAVKPPFGICTQCAANLRIGCLFPVFRSPQYHSMYGTSLAHGLQVLRTLVIISLQNYKKAIYGSRFEANIFTVRTPA